MNQYPVLINRIQMHLILFIKHPTLFFKQSLFLLFSLSLTIYAQDRKSELRSNVQRLEKEIAYTNNLLQTTRQNKSISLEELILLNRKIEQQEHLIDTITCEIVELEHFIDNKNKEVNLLNKELNELKVEYGQLIYYAYKNRNASNRLMFIFSAETFNQAYQRLKYLQYYSSYRKNQALLIENTKDTIINIIADLENQKYLKEVLKSNQENEIKVLDQEKSQKRATINELTKKEKDLHVSLEAKRKETERLNVLIKKIIEEEIRLAEEKKNAEKRTASISMTPDEHIISNDFYTNKGILPWPSEKGVISSNFGEQSHPVLKNVRIKNNGIDILTNQGENARSIFNGTVISVRTLTNNNKAVIIRHGEYFTVYSNLSEVYVRQGDKVSTKENIGLIRTDIYSLKTELHFEIWKGKTLMNPLSWIAKVKI